MFKTLPTRDFPGSPVVKTSHSNAACVGSIPGRGHKIPHASGPKNGNIKKEKQYCNKLNKDFKNGPQKKKSLKKKKKKTLPTLSKGVINQDLIMCHITVGAQLYIC